MTVTVNTMRNPVDMRSRKRHQVAAHAGLTVRQIIATTCPEWSGKAICVASEGRRLTDAELDMEAPDRREYLVTPELGEFATIVLIISIAATVAQVVYAIVNRPKRAQDRGDETSAVYAFDQIQTNRRAGYPVPLFYGLHDLGGTMIYTRVLTPAVVGGTREHLRVVLALSGGPIHSIGGVTGGPLGEVDGLGGFPGQTPTGTLPSDIRINGNRLDPSAPAAKAYLRMGNDDQSALPGDIFPGASVVQVVAQELNDVDQAATTTINVETEISSVDVILSFPGGLFNTQANGTPVPYQMDIDVDWRPVGTGAWKIAFNRLLLNYPAITYGFAVTLTFSPAPSPLPPIRGPIEVRVTRRKPRLSLVGASDMTFRQVQWSSPHQFNYTGIALLGLDVEAGDKITGGQPNFVIRAKGKKVRVYDDSLGISESSYWELPEAGDDYEGIWANPPGRNPAWILADFLSSHDGLGTMIGSSQIDWATFRDWADFCDEMVPHGAGEEARCQCDLVIDSQTPAWDVVQQICRTGRAIPIRIGNLISVVYQYRDAHGAGSNAVPAKTRSSLISSANVADFEIDFLSPFDRPAVLDYQILNAELDYQQDVVSVEIPETDPDNPNDPTGLTRIAYSKEAVQYYGVVRASQCRRDGTFAHNIRRLVRSRCSFKAGPELIACTLGDVIGVQHDTMRPYNTGTVGTPEESYGMRLSHAHTAATAVRLDHAVTLYSPKQYQVVVRNSDNEAQTLTLHAGLSGIGGTTYPAGTALTLAAGTLTAPKGAPLAFGVVDKVVKDFIVVSMKLVPDMTREIQCVEWQPDAYDEADVGDAATDEVDATIMQQVAVYAAQQALPDVAPAVAAHGLPGGGARISWELPAGYRNARTRVYRRPSGSQAWTMIDEVRGTYLDVPSLATGEAAQFAVAIEDNAGTFQAPDEAASAVVMGEEFPPVDVPNIYGLDIQRLREGWLLSWTPITANDIDCYEVRRGVDWAAGERLYAEKEPWFFHRDPPTGTLNYMVAARARSGLYSPALATTESIDTEVIPENGTSLVVSDELATTPPGTSTNVTYDGGDLSMALSAGKLEGSYVSTVLDGGVGDALLYWSIYWRATEVETLTVDDMAFAVDSGEARWRRVSGREASAGTPGIAWDQTVDDMTMTIDDIPGDQLVSVRRGQAGAHTRCRVESRFWIGGAWTQYGIHRDGWRTAEKMQARVLFGREATNYTGTLTNLVLEVLQ